MLAAAEPLGHPHLLIRAAAQLGLGVEAADPAKAAGLFQVAALLLPTPARPLSGLRDSDSGRAKGRPPRDRQGHEPDLDPDRRAWHRAQATPSADEDVAAELERTAARAKARGGLAATGSFLQRAAMLTPDPGKRAERTLAAADVMYEAGAFEAVETLLRTFEGVRLDELQGSARRVDPRCKCRSRSEATTKRRF